MTAPVALMCFADTRAARDASGKRLMMSRGEREGALLLLARLPSDSSPLSPALAAAALPLDFRLGRLPPPPPAVGAFTPLTLSSCSLSAVYASAYFASISDKVCVCVWVGGRGKGEKQQGKWRGALQVSDILFCALLSFA